MGKEIEIADQLNRAALIEVTGIASRIGTIEHTPLFAKTRMNEVVQSYNKLVQALKNGDAVGILVATNYFTRDMDSVFEYLREAGAAHDGAFAFLRNRAKALAPTPDEKE